MDMEVIDKKRCYLFTYLYYKYKKNRSQKEIADGLGVSPRAIQLWNSMHNKIASTKLKKIANFFNVTSNVFDGEIIDKVVICCADGFAVNKAYLSIFERGDM